VSVDPTEALNKKYKELEEEYEKKRAVVEEEIAKNDQKVQDLDREFWSRWLHNYIFFLVRHLRFLNTSF
jgi:hypothetical protein